MNLLSNSRNDIQIIYFFDALNMCRFFILVKLSGISTFLDSSITKCSFALRSGL